MARSLDDTTASSANRSVFTTSASDAGHRFSRLGMRGKSVIFAVSIFLVVGVATLWAMGVVGEHIASHLGGFMAERHVLWHKERVLGAINRELALSKMMADSVVLQQWAVAEDDPETAASARDELQSFRDIFSARSYFVGLTKSRHFFYADENAERIELDVVETLTPDDEDDIWFFTTIADPAPFNLNVDHNAVNGVTAVWINYALRSGGETLGVVGTSIKLTRFIETFIEQNVRGLSLKRLPPTTKTISGSSTPSPTRRRSTLMSTTTPLMASPLFGSTTLCDPAARPWAWSVPVSS